MTQDEIEFLPPISRPYKMICAGMNYREHLTDSAGDCARNANSIFEITICICWTPREYFMVKKTPTLDYEVELAFIIGKRGKYIDRSKAIEYIYGYTIYNDISERDLQFLEMKHGYFLEGKIWILSLPLVRGS